MGESVWMGLVGILIGGLQAAIFALLKQMNANILSGGDTSKVFFPNLEKNLVEICEHFLRSVAEKFRHFIEDKKFTVLYLYYILFKDIYQ